MKNTNYLYRHFNKDGELLYVGVSLCAISRLYNHMKISKWHDEICNITIEKFPSRVEVLEAETEAIIKEKPKYNIAKVPNIPESKINDQAVISKVEIINRIVTYNPIYKINEAAKVLGIRPKDLEMLISDGQIRPVTLPNRNATIRCITGFQLVDFIENLSYAGVK